MEPDQYELTSRAEDQHWWFLAWRDLLHRLFERSELRLPNAPAILDAGCGTGGNLRFLHQRLAPGYLAGFDCSDIALEYARRKCPDALLTRDDVCSPNINPPRPIDLLLCCDVIYVPGLEAARPGLQRLVEYLQTGGIFILHVPAYQWLASQHDRLMHTRQRFVLRQITGLIDQLGLECIHASYRLCPLLPLIVLRRLPSMLMKSSISSATGSDLALPAPWINRRLLALLEWENRLIVRGLRMPMGSSIVAVARKQ